MCSKGLIGRCGGVVGMAVCCTVASEDCDHACHSHRTHSLSKLPMNVNKFSEVLPYTHRYFRVPEYLDSVPEYLYSTHTLFLNTQESRYLVPDYLRSPSIDFEMKI